MRQMNNNFCDLHCRIVWISYTNFRSLLFTCLALHRSLYFRKVFILKPI